MLVLYLTTPMFDGKLTDVQRNQDIEASHDVHLQIDGPGIAGEKTGTGRFFWRLEEGA